MNPRLLPRVNQPNPWTLLALCYWLSFLAWASAFGEAAQSEEIDLDPGYVHRHWTTDDGLPVHALSGVLQDSEGYLWIGSYDGLIRFDGHRFTTFMPDRVPQLGSPRIRDLTRSMAGIWILTSTGKLTLYRQGRFSDPVGWEPADGLIRFLKQQDDELWVVAEHALFRVGDDGQLERVQRLPNDRDLTGFADDLSGRRWLTTSQGIAWLEGEQLRWHETSSRVLGAVRLGEGMLFFRQDAVPLEFRGDQWHPWTQEIAPGIQLHGTSSVAQLPWGGSLLINGGRYFQAENGRLEFVEVPARPLSLKNSFASQANGDHWLALGTKLYRNDQLIFELNSDSGIQSLTIDREGTVWMATSSDGLHALVPAVFALIDQSRGLATENAYAVYQDRSRQIWIGTHGGGAWRLTGNHLTAIDQAPGTLLRNFPRAFLEDDQGTLWVGLSGGLSGGIYQLADGQLQRVTDELGEVPNWSVNALLQDPSGQIWAGTEAGLYRRLKGTEDSPARWQRVGKAELPQAEIRSLAFSPKGHLWVATAGGVGRYADGEWRTLDTTDGLPNQLIRALHFDSQGVLWIGTEGGGLARLGAAEFDPTERPAITVFSTANGLFSNGIHAILEDGLGYLWMSSNQGIFRVERAQLEEVAAGRARQIECLAFGESDGLRNREANGGTLNAGLRSSDGRLWFATQGGVAMIDPANTHLFATGEFPSKVLIEGLRIEGEGGRQLEVRNADLVLAATERSFLIDYTLPTSRYAERARFRYRLQGYNREWTLAGARRQAIFTQVPAGTYTFRVEAHGLGGSTRPSPAALTLTIRPYFYETLWFRSIALLALLGGASALLEFRHRRQHARQRAQRRELEQLVVQRTAVIAEQAEKLRELDRLKSELFTNVSHEFRTPLTLAIGPLQDLLDGAQGPLEPGVEEDVALALRNSRRVLGLINQILEVARLESGEVRLRVRQTEVVSFVQQRFESFRALGERSGISSIFESPVDQLTAWFAPQQLAKVLDNLLANAFNLTPGGGTVTLGLTVDAPEWLRIWVRDTGPGVPPQSLERIFVRFQQGTDRQAGPSGQTTPRRWTGTGIGLALAKELVALHRGTLEVDSSEGEGATFTVSLRLGREHFQADELAAEGTEPEPCSLLQETWSTAPRAADPSDAEEVLEEDFQDRAKVLVVDDDPEIRLYVRRSLPGYRVIEAAEGGQALRCAAAQLPDLILSDVMMPGMDGFALARALRQDPELDCIPIILLTAKGSMESKLQGLEIGIDDYLTKPFNARELLGRVRGLIDGRRRLLEHFTAITRLSLVPPQIEVQAADQDFVRRVGDLIEENLADPDFGVESLASRLGCDRSYLFRKLRDLLGETPSAALRRLRLARAEQLILGQAGSISEIAYQVGFKSLSHFSQCFRDQYGTSPSAYGRPDDG